MDTVIVSSDGNLMESAFYLHQPGKAAGTGLTKCIQLRQQVALPKNFRLPMRNLLLIHPMEKSSRLHFAHRLSATGKDTVVDGKPIFIFSILQTILLKILPALNTEEGNEFPMWHNDEIYFLSDRGPEVRMNLWRYDTKTKNVEQVTNFKDYDIHFPSAGPEEIVFEAGGNLYLYKFSTKQINEVKISLVSDKAALKPKIEKAEKYIQHSGYKPRWKPCSSGSTRRYIFIACGKWFCKKSYKIFGYG